MSAVRVAVRVRPFNDREKRIGGKCCVVMDAKGEDTWIKDPEHMDREGRKFTFNHSLWTHEPTDSFFVGQQKTFELLGAEAVSNAFEGYNACIFAYGQTGSGKT